MDNNQLNKATHLPQNHGYSLEPKIEQALKRFSTSQTLLIGYIGEKRKS
jgi:hypothetical protein